MAIWRPPDSRCGVSIENCILSDTIVSFFGSNTGTLSGSTISRSFWAVNLENASNISIENNMINKNIDSPIRCTGSNHTIRGNQIRGTWGEGINAWGGTGTIIEGNTVIDTNQNIRGISQDESGAVIRNNRVANAAVGMATGSSAQIIENNEIVECITGLDIGWNNNTVRNNTVSDCQTGILVTGSGQTVSENTLSGCAMGVNAMGTGFLFYRNSFIGNGVHAVNNGPSVWDNGPVTGGNYWSGHDCTGNPSDGAAPYNAEGITDAYPFQYPYGWELGDINDDGAVDLADALIALAVMAGGTGDGELRPDYPDAHADVDDDGAVGHPDVLYILQVVAGFR
jgi:parallel beta-helix repeat protein